MKVFKTAFPCSNVAVYWRTGLVNLSFKQTASPTNFDINVQMLSFKTTDGIEICLGSLGIGIGWSDYVVMYCSGEKRWLFAWRSMKVIQVSSGLNVEWPAWKFGYGYYTFQMLLTEAKVQPELALSARNVIYAVVKDASDDPWHIWKDGWKFDSISSW